MATKSLKLKGATQRGTAEPILKPLVAARRQQVDVAINGMISAADSFYLEMPTQILNGAHDLATFAFGEEGSDEFHRFYSYFQRWLSALEPESDNTQRRLKTVENDDIGDDIGELAFATQRVAYLFGLIVGARFSGATRERMLELAAGCRRPAMRETED